MLFFIFCVFLIVATHAAGLGHPNNYPPPGLLWQEVPPLRPATVGPLGCLWGRSAASSSASFVDTCVVAVAPRGPYLDEARRRMAVLGRHLAAQSSQVGCGRDAGRCEGAGLQTACNSVSGIRGPKAGKSGVGLCRRRTALWDWGCRCMRYSAWNGVMMKHRRLEFRMAWVDIAAYVIVLP